MGKIKRLKRRPIGISPTELVHVGLKKVTDSRIELISYNPEEFIQNWYDNKDGINKEDLKKNAINWVNIYGLSDISIIEKVGSAFDINKFLLADLLDTKLRSKTEEQENHLSLTIKTASWDEASSEFETEQMTFVLGENALICFQEKEGDMFDPVRERIKLGKGTVRSREAGYLFFLLVDVIIDHYLVIVDKTQDVLDNLETIIYSNPKEPDFLKTQRLKTELMEMRRAVLPIKESISQIKHSGKSYFTETTLKLFTHLESNIADCLESLEIQREMINTMADIYFSRQNGKMNEIIKWLTIMSTIFIPLSFIAGVYGMNFQFMPELTWHYGYPGVIGLMVIIAISILIYLRKRKWI